jgi:UMF1 family MFS transporter
MAVVIGGSHVPRAIPGANAARRARWAWYLYDFGNSAYASVVLLAVYSAYFKQQVVGGGEGSRLWGLSVGIAMLIVALTSPILGAIADYSGAKKRLLLLYTAMACLFTSLLFFVQRGDVLTGMLFFILAEVGYRSAQVFYNALLPEIAEPNEMARVSGNGWAIGSAGGIVCLLIILALIMLVEGTLIVRLSLPLTALFFALFALPILVWLQERTQAESLPVGRSYLSIAVTRLRQTLGAVRRFREFVKFIVAFLVYNDGILMALDFAAIFGAVLFGLEQQQLIVFMIIVQVASIGGAYLFGLSAERLGGKRSLIISILLMILAMVALYFNQSVAGFFVVGSLAGFALTGVQSVSRAMVGLLSPYGRSAEFYGLFAVAGRTSSFIGPAIYGWVAAEMALWFEAQGQVSAVAEQSGQRIAILSIIAFLVAGMILLLTVDERRGLAAAQLSDDPVSV